MSNRGAGNSATELQRLESEKQDLEKNLQQLKERLASLISELENALGQAERDLAKYSDETANSQGSPGQAERAVKDAAAAHNDRLANIDALARTAEGLERLDSPFLKIDDSHVDNQVFAATLQERIAELRARRGRVLEQIQGMNQYPLRQGFVDIASQSLDEAQMYYEHRQWEESGIAGELANLSLDLATSLTPGVSWGRDIYEAVTGKDLIDGSDLNTFSRSMAILGTVTVGFGSKVANGISVIAKLMMGERAAESIKEAERVVELVNRLTPGRIRQYLSDVDQVPRESLMKDMESIGLVLRGNSREREFLEFADRKMRVRAKIHPPDDKTAYKHLHIYDKNGNSLNAALKRVSKRSSEAHISLEVPK
ncbi:MAG: hypothetical protein HYW48_00070 [Deltaproteobacteria bacterium]|nr:hypothetical protein [Deltaproteobacteria bacterium]